MTAVIIRGFGDMISVNLVIALARATSVLMGVSGLGTWLVEASAAFPLRCHSEPVLLSGVGISTV